MSVIVAMSVTSGAADVTTVHKSDGSRSYLSGRKFYRDRGRAVIGGVCAGIAEYFGFHLTATRVFTVLSVFIFGPITFLIYIGIVLFVPATVFEQTAAPPIDQEFRKAMRKAPKTTIGDVHRRYQQLDLRLARLERHVTSPRYRLDEELRNL